MTWYTPIQTQIRMAQQEQMVSGPGIDALISTVQDMFARGAPTQYDDTGFNKIHYGDPSLRRMASYVPGSEVPAELALRVVNTLRTYSKRQLPNYQQLLDAVGQDLNPNAPQVQPSAPNKVTFTGQGDYGKLEFHIPNFTHKRTINSVLRTKMQQLSQTDSRYQQMTPRDGGASYWPTFKAFSASKRKPDHYEVHPDFIPEIAGVLQNKGYDATEMLAQQQSSQQQAAPETSGDGRIPFRDIHLEGNRLVLNFGRYIPEAVQYLKTIPVGSRCPDPQTQQCSEYAPQTKIWTVLNPERAYVQGMIDLLSARYDTTPLEEIIGQLVEQPPTQEGQLVEQPPTQEGKFMLSVRDITKETGNRWHLGVRYGKRGSEEGEALSDILKTSFLRFANLDPNPKYGRPATKDQIAAANRAHPKNFQGEVYLKGDYRDYVDFFTALRNRGFDVSTLGALLQKLTYSDEETPPIVERTRKPGTLDGYENTEEFYKALAPYEKTFGFPLYPEQKEGIAFLYGHESSLLGDETGLGKTIQTVVAADMRMKQNGGRTVVITVLAAKKQWAHEIKKIMGTDEKEVGYDIKEGKKWTVMHYDQFSVPSQRDVVTEALVAAGQARDITCCILDECHSVKNDSHRTANIQQVTETIPFVWGASATVVANKPIDVYNQLKAVGHKLGDMKWDTFATQLGGMEWVRGPYGAKLEPKSFAEQFEAVQKLKQALIDQRVYIQRSKKQIRKDLPEQTVELDKIKVDTGALYDKVGDRLSTYKSPSQPVSGMTAFRTEVAIAKAPATAAKANQVLQRGEKVAVFTDYNDSRDTLIDLLQKQLNQLGGGRVVTIAGKQSAKKRNEAIDAFKDPNSDARAMVLNLVAGGTGLDFPNVLTNVFVNDFDWSVAVDDQSLGRFFRINSKDDIKVDYSIAEGTEDEDFYNRLDLKRKIADAIRILTEEQMDLLLAGQRRTTSEKLRDVEKRLRDAQKQMADIEENEAGKGKSKFNQTYGGQIQERARQSQAIRGKTSSNWYQKAKRG